MRNIGTWWEVLGHSELVTAMVLGVDVYPNMNSHWNRIGHYEKRTVGPLEVWDVLRCPELSQQLTEKQVQMTGRIRVCRSYDLHRIVDFLDQLLNLGGGELRILFERSGIECLSGRHPWKAWREQNVSDHSKWFRLHSSEKMRSLESGSWRKIEKIGWRIIRYSLNFRLSTYRISQQLSQVNIAWKKYQPRGSGFFDQIE